MNKPPTNRKWGCRQVVGAVVGCFGVLFAILFVVAWRLSFPVYPPFLERVALDSDGKRIAISFYDNRAGGRVALETLRFTEADAIIERRQTAEEANGKVRGISRDGDLLVAGGARPDAYYSGKRLLNPNIAGEYLVGEAMLTSEPTQRIVAWSDNHLELFSMVGPTLEWALPLAEDRGIAAVNWAGNPLRIVVLTRDRGERPKRGPPQAVVKDVAEKESSVKSCQVETWEIGSTTPVDTWVLPRNIRWSEYVAVSPAGGSVVSLKNQEKDHVTLLRKAFPDVVKTFSDAQSADFTPQDDYPLVFLDEKTTLFTDATGSVMLLDTSTAKLRRIDRSGRPCDRLAVTPDGSLIALGIRLEPTLELWRYDGNDCHPWLKLNIETGKVVK